MELDIPGWSPYSTTRPDKARGYGQVPRGRPKILKVKKVGDEVLAMSDVGDLYLLRFTDGKPVMMRFEVKEDGND